MESRSPNKLDELEREVCRMFDDRSILININERKQI